MSLGEMETTRQRPAGVFPLQSAAPGLCFGVSAALSSGKRRGTIFIVGFRSRGRFGKKDRRKQSHEAQNKGSTRRRNLAAWAYLFWLSGFHFFASFAPTLSSFQKMISVNFQVIWTSFGSLKLKNIENRVFCQCRVNSRKIGKL